MPPRAAVALALLVACGRFDASPSPESPTIESVRLAIADAGAKNLRSVQDSLFTELGYLHLDSGEPDSALAAFARAVAIAGATGDRTEEAAALNALGQVHGGVGHADSALAYYRRSLELSTTLPSRLFEGNVLLNIGQVHRLLSRPDSTISYTRRALDIFNAEEDDLARGDAFNNIGLAYNDLGREADYERDTVAAVGHYEEALRHYREALRLAREQEDVFGQARTMSNIGVAHRWLQRPDSALAYYRALQPMQANEEDAGGAAMTLHNMGLAWSDLGRPDSALIYLQRGLAAFRELADAPMEAEALYEIGRLYFRAGAPRPELATIYFDSAAGALAAVTARAGGDANLLSLVDQRWQLEMFEEWALAWLARAESVGPQKAALGALAAAERGRSQALLNLLRGSDSAGAESAMAAGSTAATERLLSQTVRPGSAGLYYLATPDTLLVWVLEGGGRVELFRRPIGRERLAGLVAGLRRGIGADAAALRTRVAAEPAGTPEPGGGERGLTIGSGDALSTRGHARALADLLLPDALRPRLEAVDELVLFPHGPLYLLPFAALPAGDDPESVLGESAALRYGPSLSTLATVGSNRSGDGPGGSPGKALVVGNPAMPSIPSASGVAVQLDSLPGAADEAREIARMLSAGHITGSAASEASVRRLLPSASLVHLATHGYAYGSEARARDSFVALAPGEGEDGLLTVGEVLDELPELVAELVVLSACQTGLGDLSQAEGTVGLQRAFLARGATSVLVSLWSVNDEATRALMEAFYRQRTEDIPASEALRRAQVELRGGEGSRYHDPRYWAAFQLVGGG